MFCATRKVDEMRREKKHEKKKKEASASAAGPHRQVCGGDVSFWDAASLG